MLAECLLKATISVCQAAMCVLGKDGDCCEQKVQCGRQPKKTGQRMLTTHLLAMRVAIIPHIHTVWL